MIVYRRRARVITHKHFNPLASNNPQIGCNLHIVTPVRLNSSYYGDILFLRRRCSNYPLPYLDISSSTSFSRCNFDHPKLVDVRILML